MKQLYENRKDQVKIERMKQYTQVSKQLFHKLKAWQGREVHLC